VVESIFHCSFSIFPFVILDLLAGNL
jgi:hypothetical protein